MRTVRFIPTISDQLAGNAAAVFVTDAEVRWMVDAEDLDLSVVLRLNAVANSMGGKLCDLATPTDTPSLPVHIIRRRGGLDDLGMLEPRLTRAGLMMAVPESLMTQRLADATASLSTHLMRWYKPLPGAIP